MFFWLELNCSLDFNILFKNKIIKRTLKQKEMRSSINGYDPAEGHDGSQKNKFPVYKKFIILYWNKNKGKVNKHFSVYDLDVKGMNSKFDANSLKKYCLENGYKSMDW